MRTACRAWLLPTIYQIEKPATLNTRTYILVQKRCAVRGGQSRKANGSCLAPTDTELDRSQPARRIRPSWLTESITSPGEHVLCEPRMSATATPYQGTSWHDRLLNRSFAFVHIWSHFVQLAAFIAPPIYLVAKVGDVAILPTGTAFFTGCGVMEVRSAAAGGETADDGIAAVPLVAVVFMAAATRLEWSRLQQATAVCCVGPLASVGTAWYVKARRRRPPP